METNVTGEYVETPKVMGRSPTRHAALILGLIDGLTRRDAGRETKSIRGVAAPIPPPGSVKHKVGRNDPCPCGRGKKYKRCCLPKQDEILAALRRGEIVRDDESGLMKPAE